MRRRQSVEMDITPLIDILFMLIIFFVLASSFVRGRLTVELPRGSGDGSPDGALMITLREDGTMLWCGELMESADLDAKLSSLTSADELLIAADRMTNYGGVAELLDTVRKAGVERAGLALGN